MTGEEETQSVRRFLDFLRARLTYDLIGAREVSKKYPQMCLETLRGSHRWSYYPSQLVADLEIKLQIVEMARDAMDWALDPACLAPAVYRFDCGSKLEVLKLMGTVYAGHPEYDSTWKPEG